jgi:hypothetical protein
MKPLFLHAMVLIGHPVHLCMMTAEPGITSLSQCGCHNVGPSSTSGIQALLPASGQAAVSLPAAPLAHGWLLASPVCKLLSVQMGLFKSGVLVHTCNLSTQ